MSRVLGIIVVILIAVYQVPPLLQKKTVPGACRFRPDMVRCGNICFFDTISGSFAHGG